MTLSTQTPIQNAGARFSRLPGRGDDSDAVELRQSGDAFDEIARKMLAAGEPELAVRSFEQNYRRLNSGSPRYVPSREALPVTILRAYEDLNRGLADTGLQALNRTVALKLNGGLGTSMGLNGPKSMLVVRDGLSFLDIILLQTAVQRERTGARLPLVLMNSYNTDRQTREALGDYPAYRQDLPLSFMQHRVPKIWQDSLTAVSWPHDTEKEWCPPGHGDVYAALTTSGLLAAMLEHGYEYLFVSNSDNLGATIDTKILGHFAQSGISFLMEAAHRTSSDRKGGHLAWRTDGRLSLREIAQCPADELDLFMDLERYRYFNTNNLWLHLPSLERVLRTWDSLLPLPVIANTKNVDPSNPVSPSVYQLETAMGAAISLFEGAEGLVVPRSRFIPVKTGDDLSRIRSAEYRLTDDSRLEMVEQCAAA